jgi:hypothetical protein
MCLILAWEITMTFLFFCWGGGILKAGNSSADNRSINLNPTDAGLSASPHYLICVMHMQEFKIFFSEISFIYLGCTQSKPHVINPQIRWAYYTSLSTFLYIL